MSVTAEVAASAPPPLRERLRRRASTLAQNPLLVRDLRSLLRGQRPLWLQSGYTGVLLAALAVAAFACYEDRSQAMNNGAIPDAAYGQYMFVGMYETQIVVLALTVVAYAAGSLALEYEKRTYEMLAVTTLGTLEIAIGKIASITALSWMLLLTSAPLAALCLMLGGVSPGQIAVSYLLLAYTVPLWAAIGVLLSILTSRSIGSYVASLLCVAGWVGAATLLSVGDGGPGSNQLSMGALSPIVLPFPEFMEHFRLFNHSFPAWVSPLLLNGLLFALIAVGAAEAMPLHRPKRSTLLRGLLLACVFCYLFIFSAAVIQTILPSPGAGGAGGPMPMGQVGPSPIAAVSLDSPLWSFLREMLFASLLLGAATVPAFGAFAPPPEAQRRLVGWMLGPVSMRHWFKREGNVGWRSTVVFFLVGFGAALLPVLIAHRLHLPLPPTFSFERVAMLLFSLVLYGVALAAYSLWTAAFTAWWKDRRVGALFGVMVVLALNVIGVYYVYNPYDFQKLSFLAHPAIALTSPVAAVHAVLDPGFHSMYWSEEWSRAEYVVVLAFLYQAALFGGAVLYLRNLSRRARTEVTP